MDDLSETGSTSAPALENDSRDGVQLAISYFSS